MTGKVLPGDVAMLAFAAQASCEKRGYCPERIFLNSPGGNVAAGIEIAEFIREWGIHTVVGETDECASICVAIFAAGSHQGGCSRTRGSASTPPPMSMPTPGRPAKRSTRPVLVARYMKGLGVPDAVVTKMITTPGDAITWLSSADWPGLEIIPEPGMWLPISRRPQARPRRV